MGDDYSLLNVYIQEPLTDNGQWTKSRCFQRRFEFKRGTLLFGGKQRLKGKWIFFFLITNLEVVTSARKSQKIERVYNFVCPFDEDWFSLAIVSIRLCPFLWRNGILRCKILFSSQESTSRIRDKKNQS